MTNNILSHSKTRLLTILPDFYQQSVSESIYCHLVTLKVWIKEPSDPNLRRVPILVHPIGIYFVSPLALILCNLEIYKMLPLFTLLLFYILPVADFALITVSVLICQHSSIVWNKMKC